LFVGIDRIEPGPAGFRDAGAAARRLRLPSPEWRRQSVGGVAGGALTSTASPRCNGKRGGWQRFAPASAPSHDIPRTMSQHTYPVVPLDFSLRRAFLLKTFRTAGAVSLAGFLAACGGDGDDPADPTAPVDPNPPVEPEKFN